MWQRRASDPPNLRHKHDLPKSHPCVILTLEISLRGVLASLCSYSDELLERFIINVMGSVVSPVSRRSALLECPSVLTPTRGPGFGSSCVSIYRSRGYGTRYLWRCVVSSGSPEPSLVCVVTTVCHCISRLWYSLFAEFHHESKSPGRGVMVKSR